MENDFDEDFNDYIKVLEARMWLGVLVIVIGLITASLIALICIK